MVATEPKNDLLSFARVCSLLQRTPSAVEHAIDTAHVKPSLRLNGQSYFDPDAVDRICLALDARAHS